MVKFTIGRSSKLHGMNMDKDMGVNTWAAFAAPTITRLLMATLRLKKMRYNPC